MSLINNIQAVRAHAPAVDQQDRPHGIAFSLLKDIYGDL